MADVVVPLRPNGVIPATAMEPDKALIAKLEEILADARSGHLRCASYVLIDRDRAITHGWVGAGDNHDMVAGVSFLWHRYMMAGMDD